jgi:lipopolysaccharide/colanic/teichoic acid biosynthesis glycosyltransferase
VKRALDILLSVAALIVLSPLLIVVAIVLRCTGEGYVLYRQPRVGYQGRVFHLYKFATMLKDSPNLPGGVLTAKNDPRILPVGRILRATKINEIPQLWNVLRGDMSLIGPRPQAQAHFEVFPERVRREIIKVRPGLSGIGSVVFHDEESILSMCADQKDFYANHIAPYKGELEVWYVQHRSAAIDLLLILSTMQVVLFPGTACCLRLWKDLPKPNSAVLSACLTSN